MKTVVGATPELEDEAGIPKVAQALAKRLANQYDVKIADMPGDEPGEGAEGDVAEEVVDAFEGADRGVIEQALDLLKRFVG